MAGIGLKYLAWSKMDTEPENSVPTYGTGFALTKLISADLAITNAEGKLYADDEIAEEVSEFSSADLTIAGDHLTLPNMAMIYGADFADDVVSFGPNDVAPYAGLGYIQVLMKNNVKVYRAFLFAKAKAKRPNESISTKGDSIEFANAPLSFSIIQPKYGKWEQIKEFSSFDAAKAWIDTALGIAEWFAINVMVQGEGVGEGASPVGTTMVANGGSFVLTVEGTPTAAYDNGVSVLSSISGGTYTVSSVAAAHNIVVIF